MASVWTRLFQVDNVCDHLITRLITVEDSPKVVRTKVIVPREQTVKFSRVCIVILHQPYLYNTDKSCFHHKYSFSKHRDTVSKSGNLNEFQMS